MKYSHVTYYIPGVYLFYSRLKTTLDIISWLLVLPAIVFLINYLWFATSHSVMEYIIVFLLYLISWYAIYEIGYLENDAVTIHKESDPTLRISGSDIQNINEQLKLIYLFRLSVFILCFAMLSHYLQLKALIYYAFVVAASFVLFKLHNYFRNHTIIFTYFGLAALKYLAFTTFWEQEGLLIYVLFWILIFPLPRTLEHATKIKYKLTNLQKLISDQDRFRVMYYGIVLVFTIILTLLLGYEYRSLVFLLGISLFFVYRLVGYVLVSFASLKRTRRAAYKWNS